MKNNKYIIGMIHLPPTMGYEGWPGMTRFVKKAITDLKALEAGGVDAALIENDSDSPCQVKGESDVLVPMTQVCMELSKIAKIPLGVNVLLNDPKASLSIAKICELDFIRTDYFVDRMQRDGYGEFEIDPNGIVAYRNAIGAQNIKIYADIHVKYAKLLEKGKTISESTIQAIESGADGVVVTGAFTAVEPDMSDLIEARHASKGKIPIVVGSGLTESNAKKLFEYANIAIVGSSIKTNGYVDVKKVKRLMNIIK